MQDVSVTPCNSSYSVNKYLYFCLHIYLSLEGLQVSVGRNFPISGVLNLVCRHFVALSLEWRSASVFVFFAATNIEAT